MRVQVERHPRELALALTAGDVVAARRTGKLAVLIGLEGGHALEGDLRMLRNFHRLGVGYMTLTWSNTNELGDSSGDVAKPEIFSGNILRVMRAAEKVAGTSVQAGRSTR